MHYRATQQRQLGTQTAVQLDHLRRPVQHRLLPRTAGLQPGTAAAPPRVNHAQRKRRSLSGNPGLMAVPGAVASTIGAASHRATFGVVDVPATSGPHPLAHRPDEDSTGSVAGRRRRRPPRPSPRRLRRGPRRCRHHQMAAQHPAAVRRPFHRGGAGPCRRPRRSRTSGSPARPGQRIRDTTRSPGPTCPDRPDAKALDAAPLDERSKAQWSFALRQVADALSPANNLATNPEAQQLALETGGASLVEGLRCSPRTWPGPDLDDRRHRVRGRPQRLHDAGNGGVPERSDPVDPVHAHHRRVYQRPLVIVPPCINKYYILDLQPANSFVAHAVEQGHTVFLVSWRNAGTGQRR